MTSQPLRVGIVGEKWPDTGATSSWLKIGLTVRAAGDPRVQWSFYPIGQSPCYNGTQFQGGVWVSNRIRSGPDGTRYLHFPRNGFELCADDSRMLS
jgi:hypothetical protein